MASEFVLDALQSEGPLTGLAYKKSLFAKYKTEQNRLLLWKRQRKRECWSNPILSEAQLKQNAKGHPIQLLQR